MNSIVENVNNLLSGASQGTGAEVVAWIICIAVILGVAIAIVKAFSKVVMLGLGIVLLIVAFGFITASEPDWLLGLILGGGGIACIISLFRN